MQLREANQSDALPIAKVHVSSWQETYRGILPEAFLESLSIEGRKDVWAGQLGGVGNRGTVFVVTDDAGRVVGFAAAGAARTQLEGFDGELYAIYLLAQHHGKGLGRSLFRAAASFLHEHAFHSMMLWVLKQNPSRGFYERLGGEVVGEQEVEISGQKYPEMAYGWRALQPIISPEAASGNLYAPA